MPYDDQLDAKRRRLQDLLGLAVGPLVPSPATTGYRQKSAFVFGTAPGGRGLVMGHHAAGSPRVVPVTECPVHSTRANRIAFALRDRLARAGVAAADAPGGVLRHLIVRTSDDDREAVAMLVVTRNLPSLRTPVRGLLASPDAPDGLVVNINTRPGPFMVGPESKVIAGRHRIRQRDVGGLDFLVSADAFFQTNIGAARALVACVMAAVPAGGRVLDLYCGSGLFSLPLLQRGATVTAVEENRSAIDDLAANVRLNRLDAGRLRTMAGRVESVLDRLDRTPWDAVVMDPPRQGSAPGVLVTVCERLAPPRIVYVSCDPEVLARDLPVMRRMGYQVDRVEGVDMFPHTPHIEAVATLSRAGR